MHTTSNPYFTFHDDVFPAFAKNAVSQPLFPRSSFYHQTIVPETYFSSLKELKHISTLEMEFSGVDCFKFEIDDVTMSSKESIILEWKLFIGKNLLRFGVFKNNSFWVESDYSSQRILLEPKSQDIALFLYSPRANETSYVEVFQKKLNFSEIFFVIRA